MRAWAWMIVAAVACGKNDKAPEDKKQAAKPFALPLTVAKVMSANDVVKPTEQWDAALATLQSVVGPPTKIDGDKHLWAAMEGDDRAYFYVSREDGAPYGKQGMVVSAVQSPGTYGKDGAIMNRAECLDLVGKGVAPEDPTTPAPRAEGPSYEITELVKHAVAGRSKWKDKQVEVNGMVTQLMGDEVRLADRGDGDTRIGCTLSSSA